MGGAALRLTSCHGFWFGRNRKPGAHDLSEDITVYVLIFPSWRTAHVSSLERVF